MELIMPGSRWTSFVADDDHPSRTRALHEQGNPQHRVRVEHDRHTLFVQLSGEDGHGWTVLAVDRATRAVAVGQADTKLAATKLSALRLRAGL
jgi:hypothetical protein